uniref:Uncharacterized protein n=1 Tax=Anguilla anguilla TaxID=7936 RepID=A0A0E9T4M8_ANGAN
MSHYMSFCGKNVSFVNPRELRMPQGKCHI